jgi:hypothetical protein
MSDRKRDPTPEQIEERAAEIRAAWSEAERERRDVGKRAVRWSPPQLSYDGRNMTFSH